MTLYLEDFYEYVKILNHKERDIIQDILHYGNITGTLDEYKKHTTNDDALELIGAYIQSEYEDEQSNKGIENK